ncbi:MAG: L,D-transpeptidase [Pseudolabrys sp.]
MPRFAVALAAVVLAAGFAPAQAELLVSVSKSQQRVVVSVDGTEAYRWPFPPVCAATDTPAGVFRPVRLERHWYSRQYDLTPMPWAMFFPPRLRAARHGWRPTISARAASHGCVRLRPDNAATLYSLMRRQGLENTKIVVMNGALPVPSDAKSMVDATPPDEAAEPFRHRRRHRRGYPRPFGQDP